MFAEIKLFSRKNVEIIKNKLSLEIICMGGVIFNCLS